MILLWPDPAEPRVAAGEALVAQWDPTTADAGRTQLLTSLRDAREALRNVGRPVDDLVLVGVGRGAVAAAGVTRYARRLGIGLRRVICVGPNWDQVDPFSGAPLQEIPACVELVEALDRVEQSLNSSE